MPKAEDSIVEQKVEQLEVPSEQQTSDEDSTPQDMDPIQHYIKEGILYEPVVPDIHDWPIARIFKRKEDFVDKVRTEVIQKFKASGDEKDVKDVIAKTMYLERIRMDEDPWKVDPKDEKKFWENIKRGLVSTEQMANTGNIPIQNSDQMLYNIVDRYSNEIASTFVPGTYHFAKRFLPFFFSTLLNASAGQTIRAVIHHNLNLQERVHFLGEIEAIRSLATKGTIVLVPTHISNVDSIIIGWSLHALGLPAFIYGAGLNLYNNAILARFMQRLGAYKVDRRKRNPIYRQTLDTYSTIALEHGAHSLFFPGGTRIRSGHIEKKLKLGLLGTAMEAQRRIILDNKTGRGEKIFIVPMVMSYHFVLEAASLINQHLKHTGREQYYLIKDEFASYRKFLKFIWTTFSSSSDIALAFGKPMDMFGNFVDNEGVSYDNQGREVNIREYFMHKGIITEDTQRDREYTRMLGDRIVERYHAENRVYSSHVVAYVAFEILKRKFPDFDLYGLLRLHEEDRVIEREEFSEAFERIIQRLRIMVDRGKVHMAGHMETDVPTIIQHGIKNLGLYHAKRPLRYHKKNSTQLVSDNMNLLYYYHNRLEGYELERYF